MSALYERIEELCRAKGITGYRLCKDIGVSPNLMTELRTGRRNGMSAKTAQGIADYFGTTTDYLLNGNVTDLRALAAADDDIAEAADLLDGERDADGAELLRLMDELNDEGKEKLLDYARDLVAGGRYIKSLEHRMGKKA